ncbi:DUF349 domain-containing protein [Oerskovia sp. NPDC056781]|uniref:DUF349 domain-containing protein n=1 Tax=Oerskovia sp. NPDC056781 TaxID=3345942 RepID=UPI0036722D38
MSESTENHANSPAQASEEAPATEQVEVPAVAEPTEAAPATDAPEAATDAPAAASDEAAAPVTDETPAETPDAPAEAETTAPEEVTETGTAQADAPAEAPAEAAPAPQPAAVPKPSAAPKPSAIPVPRPPRPGTPAPAAAAATIAPAAAAAVIPDDSAAAKAAAGFGRVDEDGTVYVTEAAGERSVGQFPGVTPEEALALYVRRYLDLQAKVALFEARLTGTDLSVKEIDSTLAKLTEETAEPSAVGDLDGLRAHVESLRTVAASRRAELEAERNAAKEAALAARTEIIEAAEKIASTDPSRIQWRPAGEELRKLLDQWKDAQRNGPRIDRTSEEALWKRFSHARTAFDRERRHYFAELEQRNSSAKEVKEKLVQRAEALQNSTDWGATAGAFRDLMTEWKAAGRANRRDDDALWARFRAAQDAFFHARDELNAATDAEYAQNLVVKEALLEQAEKLVPVTDLAQAKVALRDIQEKWEDAGKVPRADVQRVEARLRAVETAVRDAEQSQWSRSNPETRARAEGAAAQLESAIAGLEEDLAAATAKGDKRKVAEIESAITARRAWLEQVVKAAEDSRG